MSKLITCPKCSGTGTIKRRKSPEEQKSARSMPSSYLIALGVPAKGKKPEFIKCPMCNGFGKIRDSSADSKTK